MEKDELEARLSIVLEEKMELIKKLESTLSVMDHAIHMKYVEEIRTGLLSDVQRERGRIRREASIAARRKGEDTFLHYLNNGHSENHPPGKVYKNFGKKGGYLPNDNSRNPDTMATFIGDINDTLTSYFKVDRPEEALAVTQVTLPVDFEGASCYNRLQWWTGETLGHVETVQLNDLFQGGRYPVFPIAWDLYKRNMKKVLKRAANKVNDAVAHANKKQRGGAEGQQKNAISCLDTLSDDEEGSLDHDVMSVEDGDELRRQLVDALDEIEKNKVALRLRDEKIRQLEEQMERLRAILM